MKNKFLIPLSFLFLFPSSLHSHAGWYGDKYSMFIHYGLYSIPAGVFDEKPVTRGYSEQILTFGIGFSDWYEAYAREFTAEHFDAPEIVGLARSAGMRSVVLTSKHHDGFCLWDTETTDYNTYDGTPAHRDLVGELAEACHSSGMGFGLYFSLIDWHYPAAMPFSSHNADQITPDHHQYNMSQVRELLTKYGRVDELWFDMGSMTPEQSREMYDLVKSLQPDCMVSGRLGNDQADFCVMPDNKYPDYLMDMPWQSAASMFDETWGYRSWQERGSVQEKVEEKLTSLIDVISSGGKYLLNIGPMGDGSIVPFEAEVLRTIGTYIEPIKEAIYGTIPAPFPMTEGRPRMTMSPDGRDLYVFIPQRTVNLYIPPTIEPYESIRMLGDDPHPRNMSVHNRPNGHVDIHFLIPVIPKEDPDYDHDVLMPDGGRYAALPDEESMPSTEPPFKVLHIHYKNPIKPDLSAMIGEEAEPFFAQSSGDYYSTFKSIVGYRHVLAPKAKRVQLSFGEAEMGKTIVINGQEVKLTPSSSEEVKTLEYKADGMLSEVNAYGLMGNVRSSSDYQWNRSPNQWTDSIVRQVSTKSGVIFLQDLYTKHEGDYLVEIEYTEGMMVFVNGKYIDAAPPMKEGGKMTLLLPLKSGENSLMIKLYARWGNTCKLKINPLPTYKRYTMEIPQSLIIDEKGKYRLVDIKRPLVSPLAAPAHLANLRVHVR